MGKRKEERRKTPREYEKDGEAIAGCKREGTREVVHDVNDDK